MNDDNRRTQDIREALPEMQRPEVPKAMPVQKAADRLENMRPLLQSEMRDDSEGEMRRVKC